MVEKKVIVSAVIVILILIAGVYINNKINNGDDKTDLKLSCNSDLDCVASSCCHPNACVNNNYKPECSGVICSQECAPGSLDCGQASCSCVNNKCSVVTKWE